MIWADRLALLVLVIVASLLYLVAAPGMFRRSLLDPALLIGFWGQIIAAVILPIGIGPRIRGCWRRKARWRAAAWLPVSRLRTRVARNPPR